MVVGTAVLCFFLNDTPTPEIYPLPLNAVLRIGYHNMTIIVGVAAGAITILVIFIVVLCCCCRKRGKDKTGHSLNGSVLGYTDPAGEKLLPQNGTLNTINR